METLAILLHNTPSEVLLSSESATPAGLVDLMQLISEPQDWGVIPRKLICNTVLYPHKKDLANGMDL